MSWLWIIAIVIAVIVTGVLVVGNRFTSKAPDYSDLSWTQAFEQVHARISTRYPFTEWKGIDWDALYAQTAPRIAAAEASGDRDAYYMAWRDYAYAIPDGHVELSGKGFDLREKAIAGGYGLGIIRLDDGRVIVHILLEDGPAARAGVVWGAEVLTWNDQPIADALAQTSILWAETIPATQEDRDIAQLQYLVRDPVGTGAKITFQNPGATELQTVTLAAEDDQLEALARTLPPEREASDILKALVQSEVLPSGYGYVAIRSFMPSLGGPRPAKIFERAITSFVEQGVPGVILDVRGSGGGVDAYIPQMAGHFYTTPDFYEYVGYWDAAISQFQIDPEQTLTIEPREPHFAGPVIVLVDNAAISTAEGLPLVIQGLPQGRVMGIYGTHGSFAVGDMTSDLYRLPEGLAFNFYAGASLDSNERIQVDADANGAGGVVPDIRVPLTEETVRAMYVEGRDVVLEMAVVAIAWLIASHAFML